MTKLHNNKLCALVTSPNKKRNKNSTSNYSVSELVPQRGLCALTKRNLKVDVPKHTKVKSIKKILKEK